MKKQIILPLIAAVLVAAAAAVLILTPKGGADTNADTADVSGDSITIAADDLNTDKVSFIKVPGSKIELIARKDEKGQARVALGTCQSCNGSPYAYYVQEGDELMCNNCGLTFPLDVIDESGSGCHPIMIDDAIITREGNDVTLDTAGLAVYEELFEDVAEH